MRPAGTPGRSSRTAPTSTGGDHLQRPFRPSRSFKPPPHVHWSASGRAQAARVGAAAGGLREIATDRSIRPCSGSIRGNLGFVFKASGGSSNQRSREVPGYTWVLKKTMSPGCTRGPRVHSMLRNNASSWKSDFGAALWLDCYRESTDIGLRPACGRPEARFRFVLGSSPAKIKPGRQTSGPKALLRKIENPGSQGIPGDPGIMAPCHLVESSIFDGFELDPAGAGSTAEAQKPRI